MFLKDIWPSPREVAEVVRKNVTSAIFEAEYADVFAGDERWRALPVPQGDRFEWIRRARTCGSPPSSRTCRRSPLRFRISSSARVLAVLGDSVTTDHISPAGNIAKTSSAAAYLTSHGVEAKDFNQYGARRGNHEVMMRGTFANVRLRNALVPGVEGPFTRYLPTGEQTTAFGDASIRYQTEG